jgi:hypothetical protein
MAQLVLHLNSMAQCMCAGIKVLEQARDVCQTSREAAKSTLALGELYEALTKECVNADYRVRREPLSVGLEVEVREIDFRVQSIRGKMEQDLQSILALRPEVTEVSRAAQWCSLLSRRQASRLIRAQQQLGDHGDGAADQQDIPGRRADLSAATPLASPLLVPRARLVQQAPQAAASLEILDARAGHKIGS